MIHLNCIGLFSLGSKLDNFVEKNYFWFNSFPLCLILVALLLAFLRFWSHFCRQIFQTIIWHTKQTLPALYLSFFKQEYKFLKERIICSRKIPVFMCESSLHFSASPHFRLVPTHLVCSSDGTGTQYIRQHNQSFQFQYFNFFHCDNIFLKHKQKRAS